MVPPEPPGPTPIPVEGDVQIFADPECTQYAVGNELTVYARVNVPWGVDGDWSIDGPGEANTISCGGPTSDYPDDKYYITLWVDWSSADYDQPFNPGQIVPLNTIPGQVVNNPRTVFNKP